MEQDIIKNLFSEGCFDISIDNIAPWIKDWVDELVDYYCGTNLANNINDIEFLNITIIVEDGEIGVILGAEGNDGEYQKYIYLTASVGDNSILYNFNYDIETGDAIEYEEEEDGKEEGKEDD